jgi:predicted MFS family arabinose efflux permease
VQVSPIPAEERAHALPEERPLPETPAAAQEWRIIGITSIGHALCHTTELVFAGLLVALKGEFHLRSDQVTLLGLAGYVLMGVGAIPAGIWTDRWGSRRLLTVYFFWMAAAALAVTLAPTSWALAVGLTVLGAALSLYHPAGLAMIAHGCKKRGRAMGINGVAGSMGVALGPALGLYMTLLGDWRLAYVLIAAVSLVSGIAMLLMRIDEGSTGKTSPRPESNGAVSAAGPDGRGMVLLFVAMMLGGFNYRCLLTALPTFLGGHEFGTAARAYSGSLVFMILALGGLGQFVGGHTADKVRPALFYMLLIAAMVPLALLMAHGGEELVVIAAAALAVFMFGQQPVENTILAQITTPQRRSTLYGVKFLLSFGVGALGAEVVGIIWKRTNSLAPVFDLFAVSAALMAVFACWFRLYRLRST